MSGDGVSYNDSTVRYLLLTGQLPYVVYGGFPQIDTCQRCGNWRARGMACGFCDRTGQAPCPALAPHDKCNLCKGEMWVEELT